MPVFNNVTRFLQKLQLPDASELTRVLWVQALTNKPLPGQIDTGVVISARVRNLYYRSDRFSVVRLGDEDLSVKSRSDPLSAPTSPVSVRSKGYSFRSSYSALESDRDTPRSPPLSPVSERSMAISVDDGEAVESGRVPRSSSLSPIPARSSEFSTGSSAVENESESEKDSRCEAFGAEFRTAHRTPKLRPVGDAGLDNNPLIPGMPISENGVDCNNTSPPVDYRSVALSSTHLGDSFSNTHTQLIYSDAASSVASYPSEEQKEPKKPHKHQQEEPEDCCCFFSRKKKKEEKLFAPRSREKYKKNTVAPR